MHRSPSGRMTNMCPSDDDYTINYGPPPPVQENTDYDRMRREQFNDDDWYVYDINKSSIVASYGANSASGRVFAMDSRGGQVDLGDGRVAMRGMRAKFLPHIVSENARSKHLIQRNQARLEESWHRFKHRPGS